MTSDSRAFQTRAAETAKARSPTVGGANVASYVTNTITLIWTWKFGSNKVAFCWRSAVMKLLNYSTFASHQSMENFCSTADVSRAYASALYRPVYESSFWTSKEVYRTSHNPLSRRYTSTLTYVPRRSDSVNHRCLTSSSTASFLPLSVSIRDESNNNNNKQICIAP